jgi:hypothetical protein
MDYRTIIAALDDVANCLEIQGLMKEAYELDKIADFIEAAMPYGTMSALSGAISPVLTRIKKESIKDLEQARSMIVDAIEGIVGKGLSRDKADKYIEELKRHTALKDLLLHAGNIMLAGGFGSEREHQQESA